MRSACGAIRVAAVLLALASTWGAHAQSSGASDAMKEVLERAQQNERRSVEDLIEKLSRKTPATKPAPAAAAQPLQPAEVQTPVSTPPATPMPAPAPASAAPTPTSTPAPTGPSPSVSPALPATESAKVEPSVTTPPQVTAPQPAVAAAVPATQPVPNNSAPRPATATVATATVGDPRPSAELEIYFEFASAVISPRSTEQLKTLGEALTDARLSQQKFLIAGYTDSKGKADYNLRLSQQRAEAVRDFLLREFKVSPQRLIAKGYGKARLKDETHPTADANRRVQIIDWTN